MVLIMMVYHSPAPYHWKGKPVLIQPGQIVATTSRILALCGSGISRQMVRSTIQKLKANQQITVESTSHGMLITLENSLFWRIYDSNPTSQQQPTQPASNANPTSTTKNKIIKNNTVEEYIYATNPEPDYSFIQDDRLLPAWRSWEEYWKSIGKGWNQETAKKQYQRLNKFSDSISEQIQIIEQAIEKGWTSFYPLREIGKPAKIQKSNKGNFEQRPFSESDVIYEDVSRMDGGNQP
jgi:DNA replication protein DnaD